MVLPQQRMIHRVEELCRADTRIRAALQYGSFTQGEGDAHSDIEFWLFLEPQGDSALDERAWVAEVAPLLAYFHNELGAGVAIFGNLVQGEFHFEPAGTMHRIRSWPVADEAIDVDAMIVVDRTGELREHLQAMAATPFGRLTRERAQELQDRFLNGFLLGFRVLQRGELARALDALSHVQRHLLWLARIVEGRADRHFLTPSKRAEHDLSAASYARLVTTAPRLEPGELGAAYREAWRWYEELAEELGRTIGTEPRVELREALRRKVEGTR